jgi:hypothetical protein
MTCAHVHDVAAELALGVLTGRERAIAIAHPEQCQACREEVRQLMATGGLLPELLPPVEPPLGFETRVLHLLRAPAQPEAPSDPRPLPRPERSPRHRGSIRAGAHPGRHRPAGGRPGRVRRALAATAMGLAVIAAALGGWRILGDPSPATNPATARLTAAPLLSADRSGVGSVFLYSGTPRWLYMHVDLGSGDETVTCQVVGTDGRASAVGSFRLAGGHGTWGSPDPGNVGVVTGARLLSPDGVVLATATFTH